MQASLTAKYTYSTQRNSRLAYILRVEITESEYLPQEVFIYRVNAHDGDAYFVAVSDLLDIEETPINEPDLESGNVYFRMNYVELYFNSMEALQKARDSMEEYLRNLVSEKSRILSDVEEYMVQYSYDTEAVPIPAETYIYGQKWVTTSDGLRVLAYLFPDDTWKVLKTDIVDGQPTYYWQDV